MKTITINLPFVPGDKVQHARSNRVHTVCEVAVRMSATKDAPDDIGMSFYLDDYEFAFDESQTNQYTLVK
jgi:hypothetical protein